MAQFPREELEAMMASWIEINRQAQDKGDWTIMADHYAEDANYGWMIGEDDQFMAMGRDEIRDIALGTEMEGLQGWIYPYVATLIDEKQGQVLGFWKQVSNIEDKDGNIVEIAGIGGSWFGYAGDMQWAWQRDFFDVSSAGHAFVRIFESGNAPQHLMERFSTPSDQLPGHYSRADLPSTVWPPVVDA
jgi:hypothetical protein